MTANFAPPIKEFAALALPNYDKVVAGLPRPPLVVNDIDTSTKEGEEQLRSILYVRYQGDTISPVPMCLCGNLHEGGDYGLICPVCHTECLNVLERPIETVLWFRRLENSGKFIAPGFWYVLSHALTKQGWCLLDYFVDPDYPDPPQNCIAYLELVGRLNIPPENRNLVHFEKHFKELMYEVVWQSVIKRKPRAIEGITNEEIAKIYHMLNQGEMSPYEVLLNTPIGNKLEAEKDLAAFLDKYTKDTGCVFATYLPMPSSAGIVLEKNSSGTWFDGVMLEAVNAMKTVTECDKTAQEKTPKYRNSKMVNAIRRMADYGEAYIHDRFMGKKGLARSHYYGGRQPFTMRCVIGPILDPHNNEDLHLPWSPSVQMFRLHLTNKLLRFNQTNGPFVKGYGHRWSPKTIGLFLDDYTNRYHPLIDQLFQELIAESANGEGINVIFQRPPSLKKGSIQHVRVVKIITDIAVKMIRGSINITNAFNADFDGDKKVLKFKTNVLT